MNVATSELSFMRGYLAQAYAMPGTRRLLFTERLLELLSDDEIAAVTAHEFAHLSEDRTAYLKRHVLWFVFLPWIFLKPVMNQFGAPGVALLLAPTLLAPIAFRAISKKLETRADHIAQAHEPERGVYARALLRLYEDALLPAVDAKSNAAHPHLYDRLLAAGLSPDFPRPAPPASMAWNGHLFALALGALAMVLLIRLAEN
jgi:Zn-dependent protease with chaperone function